MSKEYVEKTFNGMMSLRFCLFAVRGSAVVTRRLTCLSSRAIPFSSTRVEKVKEVSGFFKLVPSHVRLNSARTTFNFTSTAVPKDVVLFQHDRTGFFRFLALFCGGQFLFWMYLAHFAFTSLRDTAKQDDPQKVGEDVNLGSTGWRYGFTFGCLLIAGGILVMTALYCRRSVSRVILHKGGTKVTVYTQSPLGALRSHRLTVPLKQVACHAYRQGTASYIPLKVKGYNFYFLLDKSGVLNNPRLFDVTVGAYRSL